MRKITLIIAMFLAGYLSAAQECGTYIELIGTGMAGESEAILTIDDHKNVEKIIVEAIHKSGTAPVTITFSSSESQIIEVNPIPLGYSGMDPALSVDVYRAELKPAATVRVNTGTTEGFFSFSAYIFRKPNGTASSLHGKLYHVFQNGDYPLVIDIPVPVSDHPKDIMVKFGITELNEDDRYAIFRLKAGEETEEVTIWEWNELEGETESFTIQEIKFEDVPGNIELIEMILISPAYTEEEKTGDSFIAGTAVLDIPCEFYEPKSYCTYTQGFYGNKGGKTCAGETTRELLQRLLTADLILGSNGNTFTITAGDADCVIDLLPGGGPSKALDGEATCDNLVGIATNKKGALQNTLLAQGITLALNLRNSPELFSFPVDGTEFVTLQALDCMNPESGGIPGTETSHAFSQEIADHLGTSDPTIGGLLDLVNHALGGGDISPLGLSQVSDAATLVNEAFDECVVVLGTGDAAPGTNETIAGGNDEGDDEGDDEGENKDDSVQKRATGISHHESGNGLHLYPNPVIDRFYISLPSAVQLVDAASIYSMAGLPVKSVKDQVVSGGNQVIEIDAGELIPGIYLIKVDTDAGTFIQRFGIQ